MYNYVVVMADVEVGGLAAYHHRRDVGPARVPLLHPASLDLALSTTQTPWDGSQ
jgi:hypothetical protein